MFQTNKVIILSKIMPIFLLYNKECDWPLPLGSWEGVYIPGLSEQLCLCYSWAPQITPELMPWDEVTQDGGQSPERSPMWRECWALRQVDVQEGGESWRLSSARHQRLSQSGLWKGVTPENLWIPNLSRVSCLTNTNVLGGCWTPISWKEGTELYIWDPSRPHSVSSFGFIPNL